MGGCTCETHFAIFFLGLLFLFPNKEQYDPIPGNVISHLTYFPIQENALSERNNNNRNNGIKSDSIKGRYIVSQAHSRSPGIVIVIIFSSYIFEGKDRKYDACWWAIRPTRVLRKKAVDHYTPYFPFYSCGAKLPLFPHISGCTKS